MGRATKVLGSVAVLGLGGLWSVNAHAVSTCVCNDQNVLTSSVYIPAVYTSGAAGDVAVNTMSATPTFGQQVVSSVVGALVGGTGPQYVHTKVLVTPPAGVPVGSNFAETYPEAMVPSSSTTGEPDECSKVLSPFFLQRMSPGAGVYYEDAQPGILVKAFGTATCKPSADGYHLASILNDAVLGGSCEKELVDYCGVPVQKNVYPTAGDRKFYSATQGIAAFNALFSEVYGICMSTISSNWPPFGIGCGGTSTTTACERAAWQVVNEGAQKAYPQEYFGLGACNALNCGYMDGWSDFNVGGAPPNVAGPFPPANYNNWTGTMLGAGKTNGALMPSPVYPGCSAYTISSEAPGTCDTGSCNSFPSNITGAGSNPVTGAAACFSPNNFTANIPQNILYAATRMAKTEVTVAAGSGITAGYYKNTYKTECVCNIANCGNCSGEED